MNPLFCKLPNGVTINLAHVIKIVWIETIKILAFFMVSDGVVIVNCANKEEADALTDKINTFVASWRHV